MNWREQERAQRMEATMSEWPTCDHKGCWNLAASNRESARAFGTRPTPLTVYVNGEPVNVCSLHLPRLRTWMSMSENERNSLHYDY